MKAIGRIVGEGPYQLGYVLPQTGIAENYMRGLGVRSFERFDDAQVHAQTYRGAPLSCRQNLVFGFRGEMNFELIEVLDGRSIYTEFLDERPTGGLHHVAWKVADMAAAVKEMIKAGHELVQTGRFGDDTSFSYFDTRGSLGHFTELLHLDAATHAIFDRLRGHA